MQRVVLVEISDSNMAGYVWSWNFWLTRLKSGRFSVGCKQTVHEDQAHRIPAIYPLRTGEEIWAALGSLMDEAGYFLGSQDPDEIVARIAILDPALAEEVRRATQEDESAESE